MSSTPSRTPSKLPSQKPAPSAAGGSAAPGMTSKVPGSSTMPSQLPSKLPSQSPSKMPSRMPSQSPSKMPSQSPSKMPSKMPSHAPSKMHSQSPSKFPSQSPSKLPSQSFGSRRPGDLTSTAPSGFGTKSLAGSSSSSSSMPPPPLPASFRTATPSEAMSTLKPSKQSVTPSLASTFQGVSAIPGSSSQIPGGGRSMIPRPGGGVLASTWTSSDDLKHAERQLDYARLSRAQKDEQDRWADAKGKELAPCPANWNWLRHGLHPMAGGQEYPGYVCEGGWHYIPDIIVAEGVPGLYTRGVPPTVNQRDEMKVWHENKNVPQGYWGPVRPTGQNEHGRWIYPSWA
ncbi:hypothetical protein BJ166DRAFT_598630 [Pestalotiopsis sp. NC0098]|nr:hypothetical protein BJ166DRAFT_598630 [Pestalotiopsis sp. NC0098]